jgi:hypothetical protein
MIVSHRGVNSPIPWPMRAEARSLADDFPTRFELITYSSKTALAQSGGLSLSAASQSRQKTDRFICETFSSVERSTYQ